MAKKAKKRKSYSVDDYELEHQKKKVALEKSFLNKSLDEIAKDRIEKLAQFGSSNDIVIADEEEAPKKSLIRRFFSYIGETANSTYEALKKNKITNLLIVAPIKWFIVKPIEWLVVKPIATVFTGIKKSWNWFASTRVGNGIIRILAGNALPRATAVIGAALSIVGLFTPASPFILTMAAISLAAVGVGIIVDTLKTRELRQLAKENDLLIQHRNAKAKQDFLFNLDPNLQKALDSKLNFSPATAKTNTDKYPQDTKITAITARTVLNNLIGAADIVGTLTGNVFNAANLARSSAATGLSLLTTGIDEKNVENVRSALKVLINEENRKNDTPAYRNLRELREAIKEQNIQTLALSQLATDHEYLKLQKNSTLSNEEKNKLVQERFALLKEEVTKGIKEKAHTQPQKSKRLVARFFRWVGSYMRDTAQAHDPFYEKPIVNEPSVLAKKMAKQAKETQKPQEIEKTKPPMLRASTSPFPQLKLQPEKPKDSTTHSHAETIKRQRASSRKTNDKNIAAAG